MTDESKKFDSIAGCYDKEKRKNIYYNSELKRFYKEIIPEGSCVMEIGSATGDLLAEVKPLYGLGIDISRPMVDVAGKKYPHLSFHVSAIENFETDKIFDYVIISNLLEYIYDMNTFFTALHERVFQNTRVLITGVNPLWEPVVSLATKLRLRTPVNMNNFVTSKDIENILSITGYEVVESGYRVFIPKKVPLLSYFLNKLIPRLPMIKNLCLVQYIVAMPKQKNEIDKNMTCSVIIPCHNEEENIREAVNRIPQMGVRTEIVIVDDGSTDDTAKIASDIKSVNKNVKLVSYSSNRGKGDAVKEGFNNASGDVLMILDADMTVLPEELYGFYNVLASRQAEFVNGTRMVYDMAPGAMKFVNFIGNKVFGIIISFIMGQRNTDTLCGTKAFYKRDYSNFKMGRCPWGDFDLLFEAARLKLKMAEMPVHYYPRMKGSSKMKVLRHGALLLKMCWHGFWYLG